MLLPVLERLWQPRLPKAYRPGATLARLAQDLAGLDCLGEEGGLRHYRLPEADWSFSVREQVESQWLLHTVSCCFCLPLSGKGPAQASRLQLYHQGNWRRSGIACRCVAGDASALAGLMEQITASRALHTALMPLDFKRCELIGDAGGWRLEIEHFAASEVVGRFPPFRRYIRLIRTQKLAMLACMAVLQRLFLAQGKA